MKHLIDVPFKGRLLALLTNIRLNLKGLPRTNKLSCLLGPFISSKENEVLWIMPMALPSNTTQCWKGLWRANTLTYLIVCRWQRKKFETQPHIIALSSYHFGASTFLMSTFLRKHLESRETKMAPVIMSHLHLNVASYKVTFLCKCLVICHH